MQYTVKFTAQTFLSLLVVFFFAITPKNQRFSMRLKSTPNVQRGFAPMHKRRTRASKDILYLQPPSSSSSLEENRKDARHWINGTVKRFGRSLKKKKKEWGRSRVFWTIYVIGRTLRNTNVLFFFFGCVFWFMSDGWCIGKKKKNKMS